MPIGAQIAIDIVNERGGVAGRYKVRAMNTEICKSKADAATRGFERLINQEKIEIVLGVYAGEHAVPLAAKVEAQKKNSLDYHGDSDLGVQGQNRQSCSAPGFAPISMVRLSPHLSRTTRSGRLGIEPKGC